MLQHFSRKAIFLALVLGLACSVLPVAQTQAQHGKKRQPHAEQAEKQQSQADRAPKQQPQSDRAPKQQPQSDRAPKQQHTITAAQAAERAKAQYGGEVLKVTPSGKGYRVKLLTESGRVLTVAIQG
jgi:uncharacterized protein HemX